MRKRSVPAIIFLFKKLTWERPTGEHISAISARNSIDWGISYTKGNNELIFGGWHKLYKLMADLNLNHMETNLLKTIAAINSLMALNNKRFNHYTEVAGKSKQIELKLLFMKYAIQSQTCNSYLNRWLTAYGTSSFSNPDENIINKLWYQVKSACTLDVRNFLLNESDSLEQEVIKKYNAVLSSSFFPTAAATDIRKQVDEMELLYQNLKELRLNQTGQLQVA